MNSILSEFDEKIYKYKTFVDICLVIDMTDSMEPYLKDMMKSFVQMVEGLESDNPNMNLRVGFVGYRDFTLLDHLNY